MRALLLLLTGLCSMGMGLAQDQTLTRFALDGNALPRQQTVMLDQPGLMWVELDEASLRSGIQVEIQPYLSPVSIGQARIDFPGEVILTVKSGNGSIYTGRILVEVFYNSYVDLMEPNDTWEQAAPVGFMSWYQHQIFPHGDLDHFKFTLTDSYWVYTEMQNPASYISWELYDTDQNLLSRRFPYFAAEGEYYLRARRNSNQGSRDTLAFKLGLYPELDELEPNDTIVRYIETSKPYRVNFGSATDRDQVAVIAEKPGYVILESAQIPKDRMQFDHKGRKGNPLLIPVKEQDTVILDLVSRKQWSPQPYLIKAERRDVMDGNEPNDSLPQATDLRRNEGRYFSVFPTTDEDWFKIETSGESKLMINLLDETDPAGLKPPEIAIELYDAEGEFHYRLNGRETRFGPMYWTEVIPEAGSWFIRVYNTKQVVSERILGIQVFGTHVKGKSGRRSLDDIYFIGFELDSSANLSIQSIAQTMDAPYVMVDSTGSLDKTLSGVFEDARRERGWSWWQYLILIAVLGGVGFWGYRRRKG